MLRVLCALCVLLGATATGAAEVCEAPSAARLVLLVLGVRVGVKVGVVTEEAGWLWDDPLRLVGAVGAF